MSNPTKEIYDKIIKKPVREFNRAYIIYKLSQVCGIKLTPYEITNMFKPLATTNDNWLKFLEDQDVRNFIGTNDTKI